MIKVSLLSGIVKVRSRLAPAVRGFVVWMKTPPEPRSLQKSKR